MPCMAGYLGSAHSCGHMTLCWQKGEGFAGEKSPKGAIPTRLTSFAKPAYTTPPRSPPAPGVRSPGAPSVVACRPFPSLAAVDLCSATNMEVVEASGGSHPPHPDFVHSHSVFPCLDPPYCLPSFSSILWDWGKKCRCHLQYNSGSNLKGLGTKASCKAHSAMFQSKVCWSLSDQQ